MHQARNVGQAKVSTGKMVGQLLMVHAQEVQNCRVQVVDVVRQANWLRLGGGSPLW